ncbi:MAG: hypothetical protein WBA12_04390 [Catalinimonas sp.]
MNLRVRNKLIHFCRTASGSISFPQLNYESELGLNLEISHERSSLQEILNDISLREHEKGRPLLSVMVKMKPKIGQGDSFFRLCETLGMGEWRTLKNDPDFLRKQRRECRKYWRVDEHYEQYF